jgi:hypothetical protein
MKTVKSLGEESWSLGRYLDQGPSEQKAQVLTIKPQHSVTPNLHNAIKPDKIPMTCNINMSRIFKQTN